MTASTGEHAPARPLAAAGWMCLAIVAFAAMAVAGRELSATYDTFEIMFYRSAVGLPLVTALMLYFHGWRGAATAQPWRHVRRNIVHFAGQNLWFYGVGVIPLAQLVSLEFTSPIWVALLAPMMLGEKLTLWKLAAAALGFIGVLVIAQPGVAPLDLGHAAGLAAALGFAMTNIFTRSLMRRDGAFCVLFWMTLSQMLMGLACALPGGMKGVTPETLHWVLFVGLCGLGAHLGLTRALGLAPATVVAPMEFVRLPVIAAVGLILYGEPIEVSLAVGAALILCGNILNLQAVRRAG